jgi:hypothetical protein
MKDFIDIYVHIFAMIIMIGFSVFYSVLIILHPDVMLLFKMIAIIVLISAIYISTNRNTYLPFLGKTVLPAILLQKELAPDGATHTHVINLGHGVENGTRLIYWGAESTNKETVRNDPIEAYGNYSNSGIATVQDQKATIYFNCPDVYNTGTIYTKTIDRHIHYRLIAPDSIMMSQVFTVYIKC